MAARRRAGSFSPKTSRRLRISKVDMLYGMACLPLGIECGLRYLEPERLYWLGEGYASPQDDYVSSNVSSTAGHRCSKSPSLWSPSFNRAWIRCCVSGQVRAVSKEVMAARSRSADGKETWFTRFFAAAMPRHS